MGVVWKLTVRRLRIVLICAPWIQILSANSSTPPQDKQTTPLHQDKQTTQTLQPKISRMTCTTVTAALTIAEQDIFTTSAEWDTANTTESTHMSSRILGPSDKSNSSTDAQSQQQTESESESQSSTDADYDINNDRQFQKFLRRFGGNRKSRA
ncbi:MAG: hypothetical protein JOS17DRAFT_592343 [Linnemannia elongata]|nr:MAG: hypothetical protein JOS17DRAFT_592343 [Linnemannia elongata]